MIPIKTESFFRIRLKTTRNKLTKFIDDLEIIDKDVDIKKLRNLQELLKLDLGFYMDSLKEHENLQEKEKDEKLKARYLRLKPMTINKSKLSKYEVARIKGRIYVLYDLLKDLENIINKCEKDKKLSIFDEINKFKDKISKEERELSMILLQSDMTYQKDKTDELKQYVLDPKEIK